MTLLLHVKATIGFEQGCRVRWDTWAFAWTRNSPALIYHHYLN